MMTNAITSAIWQTSILTVILLSSDDILTVLTLEHEEAFRLMTSFAV